MARFLHVRLDDATAAALDIVRAEGLNNSDAVRMSLREAAARRLTSAAVREKVRILADDPKDREEMRIVREQLAGLAFVDE